MNPTSSPASDRAAGSHDDRLRTIASWLALDVAERTRRGAQAVAEAAASVGTHGAYISTAAAGQLPEATRLQSARGLQAGPLSGVPFAVKDNIDAAGFVTSAGSRLFAGAPAEVDGGAVSALTDAGGIVIGKTNMHELAFGVSSDNRHFGAVRNPLDPTRTAGGSSGGSAATVALGTVPFALATDTGGSVTLPASFCGIVGFRPSTGRYPVDGTIGLSWSRDTVGIHSSSVTDAVIVDRVLTGARLPSERPLGSLRIGLPTNRFSDLDPAVERAADAAIRRLSAAGVRFVDMTVADDFALETASGSAIVAFESVRQLEAALAMRSSGGSLGDLLVRIDSPDVRRIVEAAVRNPLSAADYGAARADRWALRRNYAAAFDEHELDALFQPTACLLPPPITDCIAPVHNGRPVPYFPTAIRNTGVGSFAGVPMLSLPAGRTATGLSVGMCLEGRVFQDEQLLRIAITVEAALTPSR